MKAFSTLAIVTLTLTAHAAPKPLSAFVERRFALTAKNAGPLELAVFDDTLTQRKIAQSLNLLQRQLEGDPERRKLILVQERLYDRLDGLVLRASAKDPTRVDLHVVLSTSTLIVPRAFARADVEAGKRLVVDIPKAGQVLGPYSMNGDARLSFRPRIDLSALDDIDVRTSVQVTAPILGEMSDAARAAGQGRASPSLPVRPPMALDPKIVINTRVE